MIRIVIGRPGSRSPIVAMMQAAEPLVSNDLTACRGMNPAARCSLPEPEVRAVLVVVADIVGKQSLEVSFADGNDVIQQVPSAAFYPTLRHPVLPRAFERSSKRLHP